MNRHSTALCIAFLGLAQPQLWLRAEAAAPGNAQAAPGMHVVLKGETLSAIAKRYGTSVAQLKDRNHLTSDIIQIGQKLRLPLSKAKPSPTEEEVPVAVAVAKQEPEKKPAAVPKPVPRMHEAHQLTLEDKLKALSPPALFRLQVFLDEACLAPGKVDGKAGEFTQKAIQRWMAAAPDRSWETLLSQAQEKVPDPAVSYTIPQEALHHVGPAPATLEERAAAKALLYSSVIDYVAERFHTDVATLRRLNPALKKDEVAVGDTLQVPDVTPFQMESWKSEIQGKDQRIAGANLRILHLEHVIEVCRPDGVVAAMFPITVGEKPEYVRSGPWRVASVSPNPTFMWDEEMLKHGKKGEKQYLLPPGPNNPVGVLWLELQPVQGPEAHIGIHGTNHSAQIGRNHSSGCIRLANWDIVRLAQLVGAGTVVRWSPQPVQPILEAATEVR